MKQLAARIWSSAWTLLILVNLFWVGNSVIGRAVAGQMTPASTRPVPVRPAAHDGPRSFLYDEWDTHAQAYRKAWCRVHEHR